MSLSSLRWRGASALITLSAAGAAVLAVAVPAGASTGPRYASVEQVGYAATGAQFKVVRAEVYLRNPAQYASEVGQYGQSVQLWSSGLVGVFSLSASTSGTSYIPHLKIYDAGSHQLVASDPNAQWCDENGENCHPATGAGFPAGETVLLVLAYDKQAGTLGVFGYLADTGTFTAGYTAGTGMSFTQARLGSEFGSDPWTAPPSFTHPAAWTKIAVYTSVELQTYNGKRSTLASWFPHHKIFMSAITGSLIDVRAAPTDLSAGGTSFQDWLAPAGVNGPAQPPRS
jgi:hypothetical protein